MTFRPMVRALAAAVLAAMGGAAQADSFVFGGSQDRPPARLIAGTTTLDDADRGSYRSDAFHDPANRNYIAGLCFTLCQNVVDDVFHNFFVFDISSLTGPVAEASLSLNTGFVVGDNHYVLYDYGGDLGLLRAGAGGLASFADLGSGNIYGFRDYTPADINLRLNISFTGEALADLNAAIANHRGYFALGGAATAVSPVPEPEIAATMLLGLAALGWTARRRRLGGSGKRPQPAAG